MWEAHSLAGIQVNINRSNSTKYACGWGDSRIMASALGSLEQIDQSDTDSTLSQGNMPTADMNPNMGLTSK